jgi:transcriptional regulator with XRE-family HTH domain
MLTEISWHHTIGCEDVDLGRIGANMSELKACDLFGGREAVIKKMTDAFKEAWPKEKDRSEDIIMDLSYLGVSPRAIDKVMSGEAMVDYDLFERMAHWLNISLMNVLGEPVFDENSRAAWEKQMVVEPIFSTGPAVTLEIYILLRLIDETSDKDSELLKEWWRQTPEELREGFRRQQESLAKSSGCA